MFMVMNMILFVISLPFFLLFFWWFSIRWHFKALNKLPGPTPLPFVGNAFDIGKNPQEFKRNLSKLAKEYGPAFRMIIGPKHRVVITDPDIFEYVMTSPKLLAKSNIYDLLSQWLGDGLLISSGRKWQSRRKIITPTFHFKILEDFLEIFNAAEDGLVQKLKQKVGQDFDIYPFLNLCSLDIICETAMGVKINAGKGEGREYVAAVSGTLRLMTIRTFSAWQQNDFLFKFSPNYKAWKGYIKVLHKFTNSVIEKRREQFSRRKINSVDEVGIKKKLALLDMLLESEDSNMMNNEDIREEIDTFMVEGHDTTTSGISFTVLALANNLEAQDKVYQEIISVIGPEKNIPIKMQHIQNMKYLDMVIREVLRMYPSVPLIERKVETECQIGGWTFPKNTILSLYIYGTHHTEKYFPNPEKFDPNRFLIDKQSERHNFANVPFSAGPRNCIGQKFAVLELKSTIINIIRNFRVLPVPGFEPDLGLAGVLKSYNGIYVRLEDRA